MAGFAKMESSPTLNKSRGSTEHVLSVERGMGQRTGDTSATSVAGQIIRPTFTTRADQRLPPPALIRERASNTRTEN
jgi:hypothetical protein